MSFKNQAIIKRLVGVKDIEIFTLILDHYQLVFERQDLLDFSELEDEKTDLHKDIIDFTENSANEMIKCLGWEPIIGCQKNVHVMNRGIGEEDRFENGQYAGGMFDQHTMSCHVPRTSSTIKLAVRVFHELLHLKSYHGVRFVGVVDNEARVCQYRLGFEAENTKIDHAFYFQGLNEALVTELSKKFFWKYVLNSAIFAQETESLKTKMKEFVAQGIGRVRIKEKIFPLDDLYYFNMVGDQPDLELFGYNDERKTLNRVIDVIFQKNRNRFLDREEVFNIFAKAIFDGNIMPAARLVEGTFGKGAFRAIAEGLNIT